MKTINERITHEESDKDGWICICKNTPSGGGFYACDKEGNEMEPVEGWTGKYVCADCGRIINQETLEVVGRNPNPIWLP
jgi:hypothetical protein